MRGAVARARPGLAPRLALLVLLVLLALVADPRPALAHGALKSSNPKAGAHLAAAPRELRLTFTEPAELAVARIELLGPDSAAVALSPLRFGDATTVVITDIIGPLAAGTWTVAWQVAGRDGHPVRGRFRFTIAPGAAGLGVARSVSDGDSVVHAGHADSAARDTGVAAEADHHDPTALPVGRGFDAESPLFAAVRWLGYVGMLGLVGAFGFGRVVLPRAARIAGGSLPMADSALRAMGIGATVVLLVATLLRLVAQSVAMHEGAETFSPSMIGAMVGSTLWGRAWVLQLAAAVVALAGFVMLGRRSGAGWMVVATGILASAIAMALSGHAAAVPGLTPLAVTADALHVIGAGGWLGTLLAVVLVGLPAAARAPAGERGPAARAIVEAFSPVALACATRVALTGLVGAWIHLDAPSALWTTAYGQALFRKLVVLSAVIAIGAWNWRRVRPALGDDAGAGRVRRSSIAELAVAAIVLALTAILVATPI